MSATSETPKQDSIEIMKLENKIDGLNLAIAELLKTDYQVTTLVLIQIRDEFEQQLKDAKFDHETFIDRALKTE
jgi:hypothetical protein